MRRKEGFTFSIWWMNPAYIFLILMGVIITGAYMIPADSYVMFYRVSKFIDETNISYMILPVLFFIVGSLIATFTTKGMAPSTVLYNTIMKRDAFIRTWICLLFAFTSFGYLVWFLIMVQNGFTLGLFLNVISGEPGAIYRITENFQTVTGVTSFTNFGIPFTILAVYYQCYKKKSLMFTLMIITVVILTLFRSLFFSERLAILEILVPALIVYISVRHKRGLKLPFVKLYPILAVVALVGFFALGEYFRSWVSYYINIYPSFWEFMVTRFFGYYVTAMNTGTLYINQLGFQSNPFPYFSWEWVWKFPGLNSGAYHSIFGIQPETALVNNLETLGNPEFNNPSGLLLPYHDYGLTGSLIYWLFMGFFSGLFYSYFKQGHTLGMLLYPIWIVALLESPRYLYFSSGRFFPCWIILVIFTLVVHYNKKKVKSWQLAGVRGG